MTKQIILTQSKVALVDDVDFEKLNSIKWQVTKKPCKYKDYFVATNSHRVDGKPKTMYMHRVIMDAEKGEIVDHINGNTLDNRRLNLRIVTTRENNQNRHNPRHSIYPGASWDTTKGKWVASIKFKDKSIYLGAFDEEDLAAEAYKWACEELKQGNKIHSLLKKTSQYKGVYWDKGTNKWRVTYKLNGKTRHVGLFSDENKAYDAYLTFKEKIK